MYGLTYFIGQIGATVILDGLMKPIGYFLIPTPEPFNSLLEIEFCGWPGSAIFAK